MPTREMIANKTRFRRKERTCRERNFNYLEASCDLKLAEPFSGNRRSAT